MKAIIRTRIYDFNSYFENMYVLFDQDIKEVGPMDEFIDKGYEIIDGSNKILMPSFVVGHTHLYSKLSRGIPVDIDPHNFKEILEQLWWKIDGFITNDITYDSGVIGAIEYALNGVTTIIDHHASGEIIGSLEALSKGVQSIGLRGLYCFETSDRFSIDDALKENQTVQQYINEFTSNLFGLHASFSLSDETLNRVKDVVGTTPIHIHVAESKYDVEDCKKKYNKTIIERLDSFHLLKKDSIIVHGIYLTDKELDIIKKRKCVIALNVTSNMNNGVGIASYKRIKEKGIPVIIGNDGLSSSITTEYLNLYYISHLKEENITGFSINDLLDVIKTTYDYVSRRLHIKLGRIKKGYKADLLLHDFYPPTPVTSDNILSHLFFGYFNSFRPSDVFVNGKQIITNYHPHQKRSKLYKNAIKSANKLWNRVKEEN